MVKSLKIIPEWETCSFIEVVKNKAARFLLQKVVNCLRYAHSQHIESHLGNKQPQAKILIVFSPVNIILVISLLMLFFTAAILLCAVRDAQCKTSESHR